MGMQKERKSTKLTMAIGLILALGGLAIYTIEHDTDMLIVFVSGLSIMILGCMQSLQYEMQERIDKLESYFGDGVVNENRK